MRLKHIKLAGFKSFVDPTKVPFEQQMTAIVGPNGCGKSNIIDAVRWVLGESSAKNLRGDAMTDVIFNGSASRKPIGQASVELVFDNIDGRIQGNMADRNQISIRRVVNRESTNTYFLNGTKCRRRDITDIFLGTGLGPRSYAIIEQGTISRLIESKPQDLRVFIEEAAGISKYKERRKDTENRIRHTRENLIRLNDIRSELSLQIDKLHKQAEAAKRYRTLKTQERKYKAELAVLRWQEFNDQSKAFQQKYDTANAQIDTLTQEQTEKNIELFQAKQEVELGTSSVSELQNSKITLTNNIARTEQNIKHLKQQSATIKQNSELTQQQLLNAQATLRKEQEKQKVLAQHLLDKQPELEHTEKHVLTLQNALDKLTLERKRVQLLWKESHEKSTDSASKIASIQSQIALETQKQNQAKTQLASYNEQLQHIAPHVEGFAENVSTQALQLLEEQLAQAKNEYATHSEYLTTINTQINEINHQLSSHSASIDLLKQSAASIAEQIDTKSTWQVTQSKVISKLSTSQENTISFVADSLKVNDTWKTALSSVLSYWQQGQVVQQSQRVIHQLADLSQVMLIDDSISTEKHQGTLAEQVDVLPLAFSFLNNIFVAESVDDAERILATLQPHQSVICADTLWVGAGFVRKGQFDDANSHLLLIEKQSKLSADISELEKLISSQLSRLKACEHKRSQIIKEQNSAFDLTEAINTQIQQYNQEHAVNTQNQQIYQKQNEQLQKQITSNQFFLQQCDKVIEKLTEELNAITQVSNSEADAQSINNIEQQQAVLEKEFDEQQQQLKSSLDSKHVLALNVEQIKNDKEQNTQAIQSTEHVIEQLTKQQKSNSNVIENSIEPLKVDEQNLLVWLKEMAEVDDKIHKIQYNMAETVAKATELENAQKKRQEQILALREQSAKSHLDAESFRLRAESSLEALQETQLSLNEVINNMPKNAKESIWQAHIIRLSKDIGRLGAINLAAIEEYENQLTRKQYLDAQNDDLTTAIATLEAAIEKIDKESRQKFKNTFEQVNKDLKTLFPKVFGGGKAYLELTGTDMLDTGVTIMAQPPGKKNSTIHLLSGGEKALTALSLVFAIFRLNPAPFCMLDEVDAPLDDANVSRFCNLVREMSRTVQFIYISHNKIAMEMASHLTGVTMFEPGVSKMVAVDIDEAVAMAELS